MTYHVQHNCHASSADVDLTSSRNSHEVQRSVTCLLSAPARFLMGFLHPFCRRTIEEANTTLHRLDWPCEEVGEQYNVRAELDKQGLKGHLYHPYNAGLYDVFHKKLKNLVFAVVLRNTIYYNVVHSS